MAARSLFLLGSCSLIFWHPWHLQLRSLQLCTYRHFDVIHNSWALVYRVLFWYRGYKLRSRSKH